MLFEMTDDQRRAIMFAHDLGFDLVVRTNGHWQITKHGQVLVNFWTVGKYLCTDSPTGTKATRGGLAAACQAAVGVKLKIKGDNGSTPAGGTGASDKHDRAIADEYIEGALAIHERLARVESHVKQVPDMVQLSRRLSAMEQMVNAAVGGLESDVATMKGGIAKAVAQRNSDFDQFMDLIGALTDRVDAIAEMVNKADPATVGGIVAESRNMQLKMAQFVERFGEVVAGKEEMRGYIERMQVQNREFGDFAKRCGTAIDRVDAKLKNRESAPGTLFSDLDRIARTIDQRLPSVEKIAEPLKRIEMVLGSVSRVLIGMQDKAAAKRKPKAKAKGRGK